MKNNVTALLVIVACSQCIAQEVPPPDAFQTLTQSDGVTYRWALWKHATWTEFPEGRIPGLSWAVGLDLLYAEDEIPGASCIPSEWSGTHSGLTLGAISVFRRWYRSLSEYAVADQDAVLTRPAWTMEVEIVVLPGNGNAQDRLRRWYLSRRTPMIVGAQGAKWNEGLPLGSRLGEHYVFLSQTPRDASIAFVVGRTMVVVEHTGYSEVSPQRVEAFAWGILYRVLRYKALSGDIHTSVSADGSVHLNGVTVAPLTHLKDTGCTLKEERSMKRWSQRVLIPVGRQPGPYDVSGTACTDWRVRVVWGQRWVELRAFDWEMKTWDGRTVKLSRPAFPYKGELIAPVEEVRKALGM